MKLFQVALLFLCFIIIPTSVLNAQHIKISKERLSFLKKESVVSVVFNYEDYKREGKKISENRYLKERKDKLIEKDKDGEAWLESYYEHKANIWQEAYVEILNEKFLKYEAPNFKLDSIRTDYTMKVNVLWIYSGYDFGVGRSPAKLSLKIDIIDNATERIKSSIKITESKAGNSDDDNDTEWPDLKRVENAFSSSAYKLYIALKRVFDKK